MSESTKMRIVLWGLIIAFTAIVVWISPYCLDTAVGEVYILPTTLLATVLVFISWLYRIISDIREEDKE